jgi:hypothetical protein
VGSHGGGEVEPTQHPRGQHVLCGELITIPMSFVWDSCFSQGGFVTQF